MLLRFFKEAILIHVNFIFHEITDESKFAEKYSPHIIFGKINRSCADLLIKKKIDTLQQIKENTQETNTVPILKLN